MRRLGTTLNFRDLISRNAGKRCLLYEYYKDECVFIVAISIKARYVPEIG